MNKQHLHRTGKIIGLLALGIIGFTGLKALSKNPDAIQRITHTGFVPLSVAANQLIPARSESNIKADLKACLGIGNHDAIVDPLTADQAQYHLQLCIKSRASEK
jgi:hypothetical protein